MASILQHHNERIFPDSHQYVPERWLDLDARRRLETYLVTFGRGSRRCIGMKSVVFPWNKIEKLTPGYVYSLALAAIYTTVARLFRRFDFALHDTTRDDIDAAHDLFIPRPKNLKTLGVQARVTGIATH